eukprot:scaffold47693_cov67-Phaeocystis_antarctica.AAC.1
MLRAQRRGMPCAQCLKAGKGQDQRRVVPRVKSDAELVAVLAFKLVLSTATSRVCDSLFEPRPVLVHQELLADRI